MRRKLIYSRHADADLERLQVFIATESKRQAARAIARIIRGLRNLRRFPDLGKETGDGYRQLVLRHGKSGYIIRYRVFDDTVLITRIWHGKEDRS
ncbi:MAG: type II toxin-antitoxin system RelE/ParE family toxin [Hyphomonadaceae bacterium]|nr:type II toxin-antitoxin system RelE/ParE family toxin [Hyphomonadaceae bacterium]